MLILGDDCFLMGGHRFFCALKYFALHVRVALVTRSCNARFTFVFHPLHVRVTLIGSENFIQSVHYFHIRILFKFLSCRHPVQHPCKINSGVACRFRIHGAVAAIQNIGCF